VIRTSERHYESNCCHWSIKLSLVDKGDITNESQNLKKYDIHHNIISPKTSTFSYTLCTHRIHEMLNAEKNNFKWEYYIIEFKNNINDH
jgi:hypothetical protein